MESPQLKMGSNHNCYQANRELERVGAVCLLYEVAVHLFKRRGTSFATGLGGEGQKVMGLVTK
jgi:hypothetical protein